MSKLFSFHDVDVYPRDARLFQTGCWLNDTCINLCFKRMDGEFSMKDILFMDPSIVSFLRIQVTDDEEYDELATGCELCSRKWLLLPINDCESFDSSSNHWSLLLCHVESGSLFHFDSNSNFNLRAANAIRGKISRLMNRYTSWVCLLCYGR